MTPPTAGPVAVTRCPHCQVRMAYDVRAGECDMCGYTGTCPVCGTYVEPDSPWATACSSECHGIQLDETAAEGLIEDGGLIL